MRCKGSVPRVWQTEADFSASWPPAGLLGREFLGILPRMTNSIEDRAQGALLGLAIGDAIGTTVEFKRRGSFEPVTDMVGGGVFKLKPGQWTDDTSMALCLAASLIEKGWDLHDQMSRYLRWSTEGYMSSNGRCFDIGIATRGALERFKRTGDPVAGDPSPNSAGNGSMMRLAPVPIFFHHDPARAVQRAEDQARTTHQAPEAIAATRMLAEYLCRALSGASKDKVLEPVVHTEKLPAKLVAISNGSFMRKSRDAIRGTGYAVDSLEAALWCFQRSENFRDCVLMAANLGDDADTTAAIAGQLTGAFHGISAIPSSWNTGVFMNQEISSFAKQLLLNGKQAAQDFEL